MSNKKGNARIEKWRTMLDNGLFKDKQLLHSRVYKGVPAAMRQIVWPELVRLRKHIQQRGIEINYQKIITSFSNSSYEIGLDIPRTFPEEEDSKYLRKSLNNVLKAISIVFPKIGYCQGMNFPTLRILQVLDDEETFWLLHYLFEHDKHIRNNYIDPIATNLQNAIFEELLRERNPKLLQHFKKQGVRLEIYTTKWFINLYSSVLSQEIFNRVFEIYLLEGWAIIYAVALALIDINKNDLKGPMEKSHEILSQKMFKIENIDEIFIHAQKQNVTNKRIMQLEGKLTKDENNSHAKQRKSSTASEINSRFKVEQENIGTLVFQNKAEQMNFDLLYLLKNKK